MDYWDGLDVGWKLPVGLFPVSSLVSDCLPVVCKAVTSPSLDPHTLGGG